MTADVRVRAERLPGTGWRYSVPVGAERQLTIAVEDAGPRHLSIGDPAADEPVAVVRLTEADADVVAALLAGARFDLDVTRA